jgi:hypothetical protein
MRHVFVLLVVYWWLALALPAFLTSAESLGHTLGICSYTHGLSLIAGDCVTQNELQFLCLGMYHIANVRNSCMR